MRSIPTLRARCSSPQRFLLLLTGFIFLVVGTGPLASAAEPLEGLRAAARLPAQRVTLTGREPFDPQGSYRVGRWQNGRWHTLGEVAADRFYRSFALTIGPATAGEPVRVRISQQGGGAAHLDAVLLDDRAPSAAEGIALAKVQRADLDVDDAYGRTVELRFAPGNGPGRLVLTGRIEAPEIPEEPLQFPNANTFRRIGPGSEFYRYPLDSQRGAFAVDGELEGEALGTPFFAEWIPVGSGHPQTPTYGWVRNDDTHLYVALDVTSDNTMDGAVDYAKVHVNTPAGVRTFKLAVPDQRWGRTGFTYTKRVGYQHKVYEFAIPLAELGAAHAAPGTPLQLAFAAYGTTSSGTVNPTVTYNCSGYLVAFVSYSGSNSFTVAEGYDISGTEVLAAFDVSTADGGLTGGNAPQVEPDVAYDLVNNRYLVVWSDDRVSADANVYGQIVNGDGTLMNSNFPIADNVGEDENVARVAFDPASQKYLVVWENTTLEEVKGRIVDAVGGMAAGQFTISGPGAGNPNQHPAVGADVANGDFLVAWGSYDDVGLSEVVEARRVSATGTLLGVQFTVDDTANATPTYLEMAYNPLAREFLLVWNDEYDGSIYARRVSATGEEGSTATLASSSSNDPAVAYDPVANRFLVVWEEAGAIRQAHVSAVGNADTASDLIPTATYGAVYDPHLAANTKSGGYLVVFMINSNETRQVATAAMLGGPAGGGDSRIPPWGGPLLLTMLAAWLSAALALRWRRALRPLFHALTVALALTFLGLGGVTACSGSDSSSQVNCP